MSHKRSMHPRNVYNKPPDFKYLAANYPEFRNFVKVELSGRLTYNFKNPEALRTYSRVLLQNDFDLDVVIPSGTLIPTIPLRLNYVHWIEDLLSLSGTYENVRGIDIGTGASCVYPLLIAKTNKWQMVATEKDLCNVNSARENVERNKLHQLITVKHVTGTTLLQEILSNDVGHYDFCMCNPPFFSDDDDLNPVLKARKKDRHPPRNAFSSATVEVVTKGGEVEFITKLIQESLNYKDQIRIFSSMIGIKRSLKPLKQLLMNSTEITSFKQTEFIQGRTTRWALAWTYTDINLTKLPDYILEQKKRLPKLFTQTIQSYDSTIGEVDKKMQDIFKKLEMTYIEIKKGDFFIGYNIIANSDTWSHSRRKRREQERLKKKLLDLESQLSKAARQQLQNEASTSPDIDNCGVDHSTDIDVSESGPSKPVKRLLDETDNDRTKRLKLEPQCSKDDRYLEATVYIKFVNKNLVVELSWVTGAAVQESLHQILQYIINYLNLNK